MKKTLQRQGKIPVLYTNNPKEKKVIYYGFDTDELDRLMNGETAEDRRRSENKVAGIHSLGQKEKAKKSLQPLGFQPQSHEGKKKAEPRVSSAENQKVVAGAGLEPATRGL